MTPETFRSIALSFPRTQEKLVLDTHEFRVRDKAFATLGWPGPGQAVVRVPTEDRIGLLLGRPGVALEKGRRGHRGVVAIDLERIEADNLTALLRAAWRLAEDGQAVRPAQVPASMSGGLQDAPAAAQSVQAGSARRASRLSQIRPPESLPPTGGRRRGGCADW